MTTVHELPTAWEFWVSTQGANEYDIESIASFSTIEEFWQIFQQFPNIEDMKNGTLCLFKKGIRPAWEDEHNTNGHTVRPTQFRVTKESWEQLVLAVIGGTFEDKLKSTAPLCGISVVWKFALKQNQIELWFGPGPVEKTRLAQILEVDPATIKTKKNEV